MSDILSSVKEDERLERLEKFKQRNMIGLYGRLEAAGWTLDNFLSKDPALTSSQWDDIDYVKSILDDVLGK